MTELEQVHESAQGNYQESLRLLGDSVLLVQDFVDLYQRASEIVSGSPKAAQDEHVMGLNFLMGARYYLVKATTDCLRGHITDTFGGTRMAIEQAAFAARVKRHPHLATVWLNASADEATYDEYREKFKKLFPNDDDALHELGARYDFCAKQTHPSIYSFAGRSRIKETERHYDFKFEYFQMQSDGSEPVRTFLWILNTHVLVLSVFRRVLGDALTEDVKAYEMRVNSVEAKLATHAGMWLARIPALRSVVPEGNGVG